VPFKKKLQNSGLQALTAWVSRKIECFMFYFTEYCNWNQ